jgi:hypothetical protein
LLKPIAVMKTKLALLFALTTIALGALCFVQWQQARSRDTQTTALKRDFQEQGQRLEDSESSQKLLKRQLDDVLRQTTTLASKVQTQQTAIAAAASRARATAPAAGEKPEPGKGGFGKFLSKLMDDPDMKKVIRDQQRTMVDTLYAPLIKDLGLAPEEAEKFKDLLADNMMKATEKATSLLGDGGLGTNRMEMAKALGEEQKKYEDQVKEFLGDARYAQYKDYQQTLGERTQLNQFKQTASTQNPITDEQTQQLLNLMKEEKQTAAATTGQPLPGVGQDQANLEAMLSDEQTEKLLQAQQAINDRVYERAKGVLAQDQLEAFGKFQASQLKMQRMGMSMARKFLTPDKPDGAPPPPNP